MEFIVHVKDEYDYRFICEERDELFEALKQCYFNIMNDNLPIYGVPSKLKEFCNLVIRGQQIWRRNDALLGEIG